jgi:transcriptional regulator with XRE-family HTH domain
MDKPIDHNHAQESTVPSRDFLSAFGENVRRARIHAGLTQCDVAERTGLKQQYISLIESGTQNVLLTTAAVLTLALGPELWKGLPHVRPHGRRRSNGAKKRVS